MNDKSYIDWKEMSDKALLETIGNFIQKHRLNRNRTQEQVAVAAGISRSTLSLLEKGEKVRMDTFIQVLRVLDLLFIMDVFRIQEQISPVEYARLKKKQRKQASPAKNKKTEKDTPGW
ncbi:MAG TPA: helix-turn-helix transcriptional regulator [Prolixibacteraceae bacterium]|nr:helix-turn-helix transcriptional regulator [Prolixibacteraceae bacterium]